MTQGVRGEVWLRSATERCKRYQIPVFASPSPQACGWELLQRVVRVFRSLQEIKADELRFGLLLSLFPPALMSDCLRNCRELWRLPNYLPNKHLCHCHWQGASSPSLGALSDLSRTGSNFSCRQEMVFKLEAQI